MRFVAALALAATSIAIAAPVGPVQRVRSVDGTGGGPSTGADYGSNGTAGLSVVGPTCRTIRVLSPNDVVWQGAIGQFTGMSAMDVPTVSFMHPESNWCFVDDNDGTSPPSGSFPDPRRTVPEGATQAPGGGTLFIQPGSYSGNLTLNRNLRIEAPLGGVTIGN